MSTQNNGVLSLLLDLQPVSAIDTKAEPMAQLGAPCGMHLMDVSWVLVAGTSAADWAGGKAQAASVECFVVEAWWVQAA